MEALTTSSLPPQRRFVMSDVFDLDALRRTAPVLVESAERTEYRCADCDRQVAYPETQSTQRPLQYSVSARAATTDASRSERTES